MVVTMEMASRDQLKKMSKIFRKTGKTFQVIAQEAGLEFVPDHVDYLVHDDARKILKHFGYCLVEHKEKQ